MKIPILLLKLLFVGALFIISNQNLHIADSSQRTVFFNEYAVWLGTIFHQAVDITGYVIKFDWLPENSANPANSTNTSK